VHRTPVSKPESAFSHQRLTKLKCDEPLSNVAFNFNMRRYTKDKFEAMKEDGGDPASSRPVKVGRC